MILLLIVAISSSVIVCAERPKNLPVTVFGRPYGGFVNHPFVHQFASETSNEEDDKYVITNNITQKVDNFNSSDTRTYQQRYMVNMRFYNKNGLAFMMVGGESAISKQWIGNPTYTWLVLAKEHGAAAFQPEHRYYGASQPMKDLSTASYKYFTIEQALADLRNFVLAMNKLHFADIKKPRWVIFGGSYPGALSAWFREKNPDITIAAISSSAGVQQRLDYYDYAENVEYVLRTVSFNCAENVKVGMLETIAETYTLPGRQRLAKLFNLCKQFSEPPKQIDIQFFLQNIFGTFQTITQYTGDNRDKARREGLGVPGACKVMNNETIGTPMQRLQGVIDFYNSFYQSSSNNCVDISYSDYVEQMRNTTIDPPDYEQTSARGWMWQCCTQLGFMQTTDNGNSIFGSSVPLDFYVNQCLDIYGEQFDADWTRVGVHNTLQRYGGYNYYKGSRVVLPNGSYDPWKSIGYHKNDTNAEVYSILIEKGAHCSDMYPANETTDSASLKNARKFISQQLKKFIDES